jgi:hypothetical protein
MTTFAVYHHSTKGYEAVKQGFSWPGFFFTWIWAFAKGLPGIGGLLLLAWVVVQILVHSGQPVLAIFGGVVALVIVLIVGFNGNAWRRSSLAKQGYQLVETVEAESPEAAIARTLEQKGVEIQGGEPLIDAVPAPPSLSFLARFAGIYIEPREMFADIVRRPDIIWPLAVTVISAMVLTETMLAKVGMERIIRNQLEQGGQAARMTPEQLDQAVRQGAGIATFVTHIMGVVAPPIFLLIVAGIGLAVLNSFFGMQLKFKTVFSVACYSQLVGVLGALTGLAVILFGDVERFNAQSPTPTNLGFFLNPVETSKPLMALAGSLDIFTIWFLILLSIGLSEASGRKVKAKSIFLIYLGFWAVWIVGKVGIAALTS